MIAMLSLTILDFLGIFDFGHDMTFIIKVFVLVAILGFLNQHIENKILKTVVAIFMIYIVLFATYLSWIYVIYSVLGMGLSSLFVDYFFMAPQHAESAGVEHNLKDPPGVYRPPEQNMRR